MDKRESANSISPAKPAAWIPLCLEANPSTRFELDAVLSPPSACLSVYTARANFAVDLSVKELEWLGQAMLDLARTQAAGVTAERA